MPSSAQRGAAKRRTASRAPCVAGGSTNDGSTPGDPRRFAYADPPYPGTAAKYYADHPDYGGEVDHVELVWRLVDEFPDGWALSTSAAALRDVWTLCPDGTRLCPWVNGERPAAAWGPLNAYEALLVYGGRAYLSPVDERRIDVLVHGVTARRTDPRWVIGAKPAEFCRWMFDQLGALPGDELVDLFPGSGGVSRAWEIYSRRVSIEDGSVTEYSHDGSVAQDLADASTGDRREPSRRAAQQPSPGDDDQSVASAGGHDTRSNP